MAKYQAASTPAKKHVGNNKFLEELIAPVSLRFQGAQRLWFVTLFPVSPYISLKTVDIDLQMYFRLFLMLHCPLPQKTLVCTLICRS